MPHKAVAKSDQVHLPIWSQYSYFEATNSGHKTVLGSITGFSFAKHDLRLIHDTDSSNSGSKKDLLSAAEPGTDQHAHHLALLRSRWTRFGHWNEYLEP